MPKIHADGTVTDSQLDISIPVEPEEERQAIADAEDAAPEGILTVVGIASFESDF